MKKKHINPQDSKSHLENFCKELSNKREDIESYYLLKLKKYLKEHNL